MQMRNPKNDLENVFLLNLQKKPVKPLSNLEAESFNRFSAVRQPKLNLSTVLSSIRGGGNLFQQMCKSKN